MNAPRAWVGNHRTALRLLPGLGLSTVFLALALRQVEVKKTLAALRAADLDLVLLGTLCLVTGFVVLAWRWRVLLSSSAAVPLRDTFSYFMIGYLGNMVLPVRIGDVATAGLLARRRGIAASTVLGTVVLERILDTTALVTLAMVLSTVVDAPPVIRAGAQILGTAVLVSVAFLFVVAASEQRLSKMRSRESQMTEVPMIQRLLGLVSRFAAGLRALRHGRQLALAIVLTLLAWGVVGVGTMLWVMSFHLAAPWYAGFFVLAVVNLGAAIPSSPGGIGVYHYLAITALSVWVPDKSTAFGYAVATHGVTVLVGVVLGCGCLMWAGGLSEIRYQVGDSQAKPVLSLDERTSM